MHQDIFEKLKSGLKDFSKGHRRIADYIINHYDKAAYMTAARLGSTTGVSESTVVRFATELGYDGYPSMQKAVQELARSKLTALQRIEVTADLIGEDNLLDTVLESDIENIRLTLEETSREAFSQAVDTIVAARRIYISGARSASFLGRFMAYYFNLLFGDCRFIDTGSTGEMFEQIMRIGKEDVMIGISFPRYSTQTLKALKFAASKGSSTIAITDCVNSPLADCAQTVLLARSDMASFVDSLAAPLSLINALIVAIGVKKKEEVSENLRQLEDVWADLQIYALGEEKIKDEDKGSGEL